MPPFGFSGCLFLGSHLLNERIRHNVEPGPDYCGVVTHMLLNAVKVPEILCVAQPVELRGTILTYHQI